jgi:hypothetical protein
VTVTLAIAVVVMVPGAYCTVMVQLPPGATTAPDAQVPPVIENAAPAGAVTVLIAGAAVKVNDAVAPAPFDTVMVPVLVVVLAGVEVSAGAGAEIARMALVVLKLALVWLAVVSPVPVTVTLAVAVAVGVALGTYCTSMVQVFPGFKAKPDTQVPPAMIENVPPALPTLVIVGFAVKVNGAADAAGAVPAGATFATVIVLVDPDDSSAGRGAEIASVAPVTSNGIALVPPIDVVRLRLML